MTRGKISVLSKNQRQWWN